MQADHPGIGGRWGSAIAIVAVSGGMVVFALFSHLHSPWIGLSALGLLVTATAIGQHLLRAPRPTNLLGLAHPPRRMSLISIAGVAMGTGAGMLHRAALGLSPWPSGGGAFVLVACVIGLTEELVYRGWLQGAARPFGWLGAVALAAAAHAGYKSALFAWPSVPARTDLTGVAFWTLVGGCVLGLMRERSGSVIPAMLAHAAFDYVVYRDVVHAPWWVWG